MIDRAGAAPTLGVPTPVVRYKSYLRQLILVGDEQQPLYSNASRKLQIQKWSYSLTESINSLQDIKNRCSTATY